MFYDDEMEMESETIPREYEIDFEKNQLTGKIVEGSEAIKMWVWMALKTPKGECLAYTHDYGSELESLIGKGYSKEYINSEVKRMVTECISQNKNITGMRDFFVNLEEDKLNISFTLETKYGKEELSIENL